MPKDRKRLEEALKRSAAKRGLRPGTERYKRYVYGTLNKITKVAKERKNGQ